MPLQKIACCFVNKSSAIAIKMSSGSSGVKTVSQLQPTSKNFEIVFIILEKGVERRSKKGFRISDCLVADQSGSVRLPLWDNYIDHLQIGDICRLRGGYCNIFQERLSLNVGKTGRLERIGEFCMPFAEFPKMSEIEWTVDPNNRRKYIAKKR